MTYEDLQNYYNKGYICIYDGEPINEVTDKFIYGEYGTEYKKEEVKTDYIRVLEIQDEIYLPSDMNEICTMLKNTLKQLGKFENANGKKFTLLMQDGNIVYAEEVNELFDISTYYDRSDSLSLNVVKEVK